MEITGVVKWVSAPRGEKQNAISFVIEEVNVQYPKSYVLEVYGDRYEKNASKIVVGAMLLCKFDGKASEWNGRWYNSLNAWFIGAPQAQQPMYGAQPQYQQAPPPQQYAQPAPQYQQAPQQGYPQGGYQQAPPQPQYQPQQNQMPFPPPTPGGQGAF